MVPRGAGTLLVMAESALSADDFWATVVDRGWGAADTDVLADDELLELASGMGPVVISQRGLEALVSTIPLPPPGDDEVIFHTEDGPAGERIAWVVLHCVALGGLAGGGTAVASADAIVERLDPDDLAVAEDAIGSYAVFGHRREWKLLTRLGGGGWSIDLPGATRGLGDRPRGLGEIAIPSGAHRAAADRVEALAREVAEPVAWTPGRILVFDNRRYLHARLPIAAGTRTLKRVLVGGLPGAE